MGKLKTHKSFSKRLTLKKSGKIFKKKAGQDHFNARERGNTTRNKRRSVKLLNAKIKHTVRHSIPYT